MLLMVEKGISRGICHSIIPMQDYDKIKNCHIFNNEMYIIFPVNNFDLIKDTSLIY